MFLYEGIYIDDKNNVKFNWDIDNEPSDIIKLNTSSAGVFNRDNFRYIYGYCYTSEANRAARKIVRDHLKDNPYDENVEHFIETALFQLDHMSPLESFNIVVTVESKSSGLVDQIELQLLDVIPHCASLHLIKELYDNIKFNEELVIKLLKDQNKADYEIKDIVDKTRRRFENFKAEKRLFKIKDYMPTIVRFGFEDFLKFKTEEDKQLFKNLQGANVLVVDDFLTSGAPIKEMTRYLTSINPTNKITVFVLVNQKHD